MSRFRFWMPFSLLITTAVIYLVIIPREAIFRDPQPIVMSPADAGLTYENVQLQPADHPLRLAGWWIPARNPRATLVFVHGGGSNRHSQFFGALEFYRAMVEHGVSVLTIDLRNHGDSGIDGRGMQFGASEKHDASAAIAWAHERAPDVPVYAMGISMGGAAIIHAVSDGAQVSGLILLDPLLDTWSAVEQGAWTDTGLSPALFRPAAWALTAFYGLPGGEQQALARAAVLDVPSLLIQDPTDPVTRASHALELARRNPSVQLWLAPALDNGHADLAWKGRWGSHVAAFAMFPRQTLEHIMRFIAR